jgi:serine/threonine-protein kinase
MNAGADKLQDRFDLIEEIGEGGFARVYRARDRAHGNRIVAVKVLKDAYLGDREIVERFRREVFAVASISSPHVVAMTDFGISGDEVFIAMEFVEGPNLRDIIYDRAWNANEVHLIIGQIAQALAAAHRQNIVHRDLKPENVILVPGSASSRTVKVLDFGLAKLAELERKLELEPITRVGMCFGTPQYMAPELIQGRKFDKSVDLYALGVIAYEMLSGKLPWDGADAREVLLSVVKNPAPRLAKVHATIQPRLDEVNRFLVRALGKEPKLRPRDAAEFFREFEDALFAGKPPRVATQVPPDEAVFASVWAASLPIDLRDTDPEDTLVDLTPGHEHAAGTNAGASGVRRKKQRLRSSWMLSLVEVQTIGIDDEPHKLLRDVDPAARDHEQEPLPSHLERTDIVERAPPRRRRKPKRSSTVLWLIPLVFAIVALAATLGYFVGRGQR